jgi:hypothetical protein
MHECISFDEISDSSSQPCLPASRKKKNSVYPSMNATGLAKFSGEWRGQRQKNRYDS